MACENHIILYPIFPHFQNIFLGILGFILDESLDLLLGCVQAFFLFHLQLYFEQEVSYFQRLCQFGVVLSLHKLSSSTCERRLGRQLLVKALIVLRVESFPSFTIFLSVIPESQFGAFLQTEMLFWGEVLQEGFSDQWNQHHLGICRTCRFKGPVPNLLNRTLWGGTRSPNLTRPPG